jgi:DNA-binding response OmpR family regulator
MCILVVEDDFLIRMILVDELRDAGFEVREAETGDAAVDVLNGIDPPLTVLVTDIHMPGTRNGIDLARHVRAACPAVPVIYTTGRPDALNAAGRLGQGQFLVAKPYMPADIIARVRLLLAA